MGQTYSWSNPNGGSFGDSGNWLPNGIPGAQDSAFFNLGGDATYTVSGNGAAGYILVYDNVTFTGAIDVDQLSGTFTAFQVGGGGSAIFDGGSLDSAAEARIGDNNGSGALTFEGGGTGTLAATSTANALDVAFADESGVSTSGTVSVDGGDSSLTLLGGAYIGTDGAGTLMVTDGGFVQLEAYASTYTSFEVGEGTGATGLVEVTTGGTLSVGDYTVIGDAGTGQVDFSAGSTGDFHGTYYTGSAYEQSYALYLGGNGGNGTLSVDGPGTSVTADDGVLVGQYGDGTLSVTNHATFTIDTDQSDALGYSFVGSGDTANGTLIVSGSAVFNDNSVLAISDVGQGTIEISSGGTVISDALAGDVSGELGAAAGGTGTGTIDDGLWDAKQSFAVGYQGDGTLTVQDGGTLEVDGAFLRVARDPGSSGTLTVDDATVTAPNAVLTVGPDSTNSGDGTGGNGILNIENGGTVTAGSGVIGGLSGGTGSVDVNDSSLDFSGNLTTGAGTSTLTAEDGGRISAAGSIVIGGGGLASVEVTNSGSLADTSGGITIATLGTLALDASAHLENTSGGMAEPLVLDGGTLDVLGDGALQSPLAIDVTGGTPADPSFIIGGPGADVVIAGGITFTATTPAVLLLGTGFDTNNAINQMSAGDTLDVQIAAGDVFDTATYDAASNTLTLSETSNADTLTLHIADDGYSANSFMAVADNAGGTDVFLASLCYLRGTRILTPVGAVCIEDLAIGDLVVTRFGGIRPIKWIGRQTYNSRVLGLDGAHNPVCIRAGALGENMPLRDLLVSPGHSMLIEDALVLAQSLVNGITIIQEVGGLESDAGEIDYFQLDLGTHDCVIAEGVWSETFADGPTASPYGLRGEFHNVAEFCQLYPDDPAAEALVLCAPRPLRGRPLEKLLAPIVARAEALARTGVLEGYIDVVTGEWDVEGWALDRSYPELPVRLEVFLGDRLLGTVLACELRDDLRKAGKGRGRCAFRFRSPVKVPPETLGELSVRRASDGARLPATDRLRPSNTWRAACRLG